MTNIEEDFLCKTNDIIDNAAWNAILAVHHNSDEWFSVISAFINSVRVERDKIIHPEMCSKVANYIRELLESNDYPAVEDADGWSMEAVGKLEEFTEMMLGSNGVSVCHPFVVDDEVICYKSGDRCSFCTR